MICEEFHGKGIFSSSFLLLKVDSEASVLTQPCSYYERHMSQSTATTVKAQNGGNASEVKMNGCIFECVHVCMYRYNMHVYKLCMQVCVCVYVCMHINMCMGVCMYVCMYVCMQDVCVCACEILLVCEILGG